jgi:hypothetical protein
MDRTPLLDLPYIMPSQAQKHVTHNEALSALDAIVQLSVLDADLTAPPAGPSEGERYLVAAGATGVWAGKDGMVAAFADGDWLFVMPRAGWICFVEDESQFRVHTNSGWTTLEGASDVSTLGINSLPLLPERLSIASPSSLFSHEGTDHRLKVNKAGAGDTASIVFQNGFSGRAEMGLCGDDGFAVKVSPDGSAWFEGLKIDPATGVVSLPADPASVGLVRQSLIATKGTIFTTTSTSFQNTGLSVSIAPKATASRIRVHATVTLGASFWYTAPRVAIFRDSTQVWPAAGGSGLTHQFYASNATQAQWQSFTGAIEFEDLPATTSAVAYSVRLASRTSGYNVHLNARDNDLLIVGESSISVTELRP